MLFNAHVGAREQRGGERHKSGQGNQEYIELVNEELLVKRDLRPDSTTRRVNITAAAKVPQLISELSSAAQRREPNRASSIPPSNGVSNSTMS